MTVTTIPLAGLPAIGTPFGGGLFGGAYLEYGTPMALIVPPKALGQSTIKLPYGAARKIVGARSLIDGLANTRALGDASPAAKYCLDLRIGGRSEEHTSELQSLMRTSYAVFRLKNTHTASSNSRTTYHVH